MVTATTTLETILIALPATIAAIGAAIAAVIGAKKGTTNENKIEDVHTLVNDRSEKQDARIQQLGDSLQGAGIEIPPKPGTN